MQSLRYNKAIIYKSLYIHHSYIYKVLSKLRLYDFGSQRHSKNKSLLCPNLRYVDNLTATFNYYRVITLKPNTGIYTPTSELYTNESAKKKTCAKLQTTASITIAGGQ